MSERLSGLLGVPSTTPMVPPRQTQFTPAIENLYSLWKMRHEVPESNDYDMRGFFLGTVLKDPAAISQINASDNRLHFSDKWKLPNHKSFSNESIYSTAPNDPRWVKNPAPYKDGTWAQQTIRGLLNVESPY